MEIFCASLNFKQHIFAQNNKIFFAEMHLSRLLMDVLLHRSAVLVKFSVVYVEKKLLYDMLQKYGTKLNEYIWHLLGIFVLFRFVLLLAPCSATCGSPPLPLGSLSTAAHTLTGYKYLIQLHFKNKTKKQTQYLFKAAPFLLPQLCGCDKKLGKYNIFVPDWPLIAVVYHRARCEFPKVVLSVAVSLIIRRGITLALFVSRMKNGGLTRNNCYKLRSSGSLVTKRGIKDDTERSVPKSCYDAQCFALWHEAV